MNWRQLVAAAGTDSDASVRAEAPRPDGAVGLQRERVRGPARDGAGRAEAGHGDGGAPQRGGVVAELAVRVATPGAHRAVRKDGERVPAAGADRRRTGNAGDRE